MKHSFDNIRDEARAYGMECNAADRSVAMTEFCERMGMNRQWLSAGRTGHSQFADQARAIVLKEWAAIGVKANDVLTRAIAEAGEDSHTQPGWVIPESDWPHYSELTSILAEGHRREMFTDLRNRYGREVAMRYAYVCDNSPTKGARQGKNAFDVAV